MVVMTMVRFVRLQIILYYFLVNFFDLLIQ